MTEMAFKQENIEEFYDILDEIGSGQFAVVKRCKEKSTGAEFAAKFVKRKRGKRERKGVTAEQIANEANVLRKVRHDGIIYLHDVFETSTQFTLILELLSGGELFEFLVEQEYLTENEAMDFSKQVVEAVDYLHDCHIVHLDIKPENIVLKDRTEKKLKLIDFGLAKIIPPGEIVKAIMGTPEFVAPEVINFEPVGSATDMWAVGVLTYILLSGASPFLGEDINETFISIQNVDFDFDDELFGSISSQAKDFISNLLVKNPSKRLTARETLSHSWLQPEPAQRLKRRSTLIKTEAHKAFTARVRWKQSLKKVIAMNRMAILGRKDGELLKDVLFQSDTSDTSDSESEMPEAIHLQKKNKIISESKLVQDTSHIDSAERNSSQQTTAQSSADGTSCSNSNDLANHASQNAECKCETATVGHDKLKKLDSIPEDQRRDISTRKPR